MTDTIRMITWNANGLISRLRELEVFLHTNYIDIALISETHLTNKNFIKIQGYQAYSTVHPTGSARGGSTIFIKQTLQHYQQEAIQEDYFQGTVITIQQPRGNLNIAAAYCPPCYRVDKQQFANIFKKLGHKFILAGDFNAKHTAWGSRLITPKGRELLKALNEAACDFHSSRKPTHWPTNPAHIPDLLDFFITKGITLTYLEVESIADLSSDHTPVLLTLSTTIIKKTPKKTLTTKSTDWDIFRDNLDALINLKIPLKTIQDLEQQTQEFINAIRTAAEQATPQQRDLIQPPISYPIEVWELLTERRRRRRIWHQTRNPLDKRTFNHTSNKLRNLLKSLREKSLTAYLENLSPTADKDYSLWRATKRFK